MNERMSIEDFRRQYGFLPANQKMLDGGKLKKQRAQIRMPKERKVTSIEAEWRDVLMSRHFGCEVKHEPFAFNLMAGTRYTPDLVVMRGAEIVEVWETKPAHMHKNAARSIAAFKQAAAEWPKLKFGFAQKRESGWCEEIVNRKSS